MKKKSSKMRDKEWKHKTVLQEPFLSSQERFLSAQISKSYNYYIENCKSFLSVFFVFSAIKVLVHTYTGGPKGSAGMA